MPTRPSGTLIDLRKRIEEMLVKRRAEIEQQLEKDGRSSWRSKGCSKWRKRIEGKESPAEIS